MAFSTNGTGVTEYLYERQMKYNSHQKITSRRIIIPNTKDKKQKLFGNNIGEYLYTFVQIKTKHKKYSS